ncbi:hypothetical protein AK830_g5972 [Neonectria ditissima]|uniref:Uncharacterized protein n=1 Tax=Neonectria ditissima TaxID=78410 RepID=A0A0N8H729_9HYPO|nr:hypothetical protein AK830_g5972 [Neonectria ditissima]
MHASTILVALSALASASASTLRYRAVEELAAAIEKKAVGKRAAAAPAPVMQKRADQTAAWVQVDDEGQPAATNTPSMTVVDGVTSIENGAPHDITASVYTITANAKVTTSTGDPPNPTATAKNGQGAFARCHNMDGEHAPFCDPSANSTLFVGSTYYVTWDPDYYNKTKDNTTATEVSVRLDYLNTTSGELKELHKLDRVPAAWGFSPLKIESKYLKGYGDHNITLTLYSNANGSAMKTKSTAMWVQLSKVKLPKNEDTPPIDGDTLTIALPIVFGSLVLLIVGVCLWNRKTRRISLGNIMSRKRAGYTGRKQRRMFGRKDNGIQLDTRATPLSPEYRDAPTRPRRDSDSLDSLANSPVEPTFHQQGTTGGRNVFRDEVQRQDRERF